MKKSELKALIKECVKETLFEEGVLSEIIAEVAFGITKAQSLMVEQQQPTKQASQQQVIMQQQLQEERAEEQRKKLLETKRKMLDAIGGDKMNNVFEGTEPLRSQGTPSGPQAPQGPLSGLDPSDSGVDISGLFSLAGNKWKALK
jgi:hypothetical protein